jgi:hypothetical protein
MFQVPPHRRPRRIGLAGTAAQWPADWLPPVDTADPADEGRYPGLGLAPAQGNGWVRFQPALSRKVGQISTGVDTVVGGCAGDHPGPVHLVSAVDRDARFVATDRDRSVDQLLAVRAGLGPAELHRPSRIGVLLAGASRFVGPDLVHLLTRRDPGLLALGVALAGRRYQCPIFDLTEVVLLPSTVCG